MKINLIIATYSGFYPRKFNEHNFKEQSKYLRYNLKILDTLKTTISQISIIKPQVDNEHIQIKEYYDFDKLDIPNIRDKIKVYETENIGVSYGQLFHGIFNALDFDYHIFIEDDYLPFRDYFEIDFISEFKKHETDSLVCSYYYKDCTANVIDYFTCDYYRESDNNIHHLHSQFEKYNWINKPVIVPDFSLIILSRDTVNKIQNIFTSLDNIKEFFNMKLKKIELHQILFGSFLNICGIKIYDIAETYLNIFYQSFNGSILLCNWDKNGEVMKWKELEPIKKFSLPIFIPLNILQPNNYDNDINCMLKYISNPDDFIKCFNNLNVIKNSITDL